MRHPDRVWADPAYAQESLVGLKQEWVRHLGGRARATSPRTIQKYEYSLGHFTLFLAATGQDVVLASLTPANIDAWVTDQRSRNMSEDGIASRLTVLKVFSNRYVFKQLEATTVDLLAKVDRINPPEKPVSCLTGNEQETLLDAFDRHTYEDVRNKAMLGVFMATGLRLAEVLGMTTGLNTLTGEFQVIGKGRKWRAVRLSDRAIKLVRSYLKIRPETVYDDLWLTEPGEPLQLWGAQSIFRRLKKRSGVEQIHAHLLRHNFAKKALQNGVERGVLQDMLGHSSPSMTNRYLGDERKVQAAALMPAFSPI